jgi:hypothetical protein
VDFVVFMLELQVEGEVGMEVDVDIECFDITV